MDANWCNFSLKYLDERCCSEMDSIKYLVIDRCNLQRGYKPAQRTDGSTCAVDDCFIDLHSILFNQFLSHYHVQIIQYQDMPLFILPTKLQYLFIADRVVILIFPLHSDSQYVIKLHAFLWQISLFRIHAESNTIVP